MSAVRAHHKKKLEKNFIGIRKIGGTGRQMSEAVLTTDLAELAGPIREDAGKAGIRETGIGGVAAAVEASADGPAAIYSVFCRGIQAKSVLRLEKSWFGARATSFLSSYQLFSKRNMLLACIPRRNTE